MQDRTRVGGYPVDHAVIAGTDLETLASTFEAIGLEPEYGGAHEHDVTHNSLLGLDDGSYVELISTADPGVEPDKRAAYIGGNAGPCGWAVGADDVGAVAETMANRGVAVERSGPQERETPDGDVAAWRLAYLGEGEPGTELPFVIEDRTPRENRIAPSPSAAGTEITGVGAVVVGVPDLDDGIALYRRAFDLPEPERGDAGLVDAELAAFDGSAVVLAAPRDGNWLADRVDRYGVLPCAVLLATREFGTSRDRFGSLDTGRWFGRRVGWAPYAGPVGGRIGVVER